MYLSLDEKFGGKEVFSSSHGLLFYQEFGVVYYNKPIPNKLFNVAQETAVTGQ